MSFLKTQVLKNLRKQGKAPVPYFSGKEVWDNNWQTG